VPTPGNHEYAKLDEKDAAAPRVLSLQWRPQFTLPEHGPAELAETCYWFDYQGTRIIFVDSERSNWTWDPVANAYYWHRFYSHQPDLNFDNPAVMAEVKRLLHYWLDMGVDGLRLDATQNIYDRGAPHILAEVARAVRRAAPGKETFIVAENESQEEWLVRPEAQGGYGLDALWNDDFHHSAVVAALGRNDAYYEDHFGEPQEFVSAAKHGFLFQGQHYAHQDARRGEPAPQQAQ
jgi:glycosidase